MQRQKDRMPKKNGLRMRLREYLATSAGNAFYKTVKITLIYSLAGCLWIVFSDLIVESIFKEQSSITLVSISKGVFYVIATAALIFSLVYSALKKAIAAQKSAQAANALLEKANLELTREKEKLVESESRLRANEALFRSVFDQASIGIYIGHNSRYVEEIFGGKPSINPMFAAITGRTIEELASLHWTAITHPEDIPADKDSFEKLKAGMIDGYDMEKRYLRPDGSEVWAHIIMSRLYLENLSAFSYLCLIEDISKRKQQEIKLKYLSEHDPLTGVYNRSHFEEVFRLDLAKNADVPKALLLITLNDFGTVNATHGYLYGESLVKAVAIRLTALCTSNCHLFHIANERFIFYVRGYGARAELEALCQSVIDVLDSCLADIRVYGTIGVLELDGMQHDEDGILKLASIAAQYASKSLTERYSFFDRNMEASINRRELIKSELLKSLRNDENPSLSLVFQPIYHAQTSDIYGFEALARFKSDVAGQVSPAEFIPIAEEAQLIVSLGRKIIRLSCQFLKRMEEKGILDKIVSINISAIELLRDDFLPELMKIIGKTGVNARRITLEITESVFSDNFQKINEKLSQIREKGFSISIDDFGTGYSSLARENELNVSCLKLDKQFIDGILLPDPKEVIAGDIISMAHKLGHSVVAEGVEQETQRQYLLNHQCDYIQGYLLSRPLPEEKAMALLN